MLPILNKINQSFMKNISVQEVRERLAAGEQLNLLDVREPSENAEFNIGGTLYPLGKIQSMQVDPLEDWKDKEIIVYCRSGRRSATACMYLETLGFSDPKNMEGGVLAWQAQEGPVK
jgi:rhodanese-related sulfurtransferase